ncbi:MAG: UDP-glucuronic acid decarboxylase family protein [Acidimicrobiales bacterium]
MRHLVVTGGAGFVGSHLCDALVSGGDTVTCIDDFSSGRRDNVASLEGSGRFRLLEGDVAEVCAKVEGGVDAVAHLASPASPADYLANPIKCLTTGSRGTEAALGLAREHNARFLLASTSEVYGDPLVHPQHESYWGNVNPIGPRSVYDEAKRFSEALSSAYRRALGTEVGIVRIFNTYGPRLRPGDGRVVSNFIVQALAGQPLTVYGDGTQTRSFCYVDDLVAGLLLMLSSDTAGPVNLGNPRELTVAGLATLVLRLTGSSSPLAHRPVPEDDPTRRRPDIARAKELLGWEPAIAVEDGMKRTIDWFIGHREHL